MYSEGGTGEDRRIDPPLNFGIYILQYLEKIGSDHSLDSLLDTKDPPILP